MRAIVAGSVLFFAPYAVFGQSAAGAPAFDVASVKAIQGGRGGRGGFEGHAPWNRRGNISTEPGILTMRHVNLISAIGWAYGVQEFQVSGPAWLGSERYLILAKAAGPAPEDQLRLMLQTLLADRFKLALHREEKVSPFYILTVTKGGPKFHESTSEGEPGFTPGPDRTTAVAQRVPVSQFIDLMQSVLHAPVLDQTGLKGRYDIKLDFGEYATHPIQNDEITGVVAGAVQDLLGLKLEPKKGPMEMIVVDHAEKVPTEN